jgi:hypothetical protein
MNEIVMRRRFAAFWTNPIAAGSRWFFGLLVLPVIAPASAVQNRATALIRMA